MGTRIMQINVTGRDMVPPKAVLMLSLSCLALVAGCKPGELGSGLSGYESPFEAPAPVNPLVLLRSFIGEFSPIITTQTAALFENDARYYGQSTNGWSIDLASGQTLTGLVSNPLKSSGAAFAHVAGLTGTGSKIAVSDEQYIKDYAEFTGSNEWVVNNWEGLGQNGDPLTGHGTIVAAVALGDSDDFIGTAPDAHLIFGSYQTDQKLADLGTVALNQGAVAWNNSWGFTGLFANQAAFDQVFTRTSDSQDYLAALDTYAQKGVVVFAVSNDNTDRHAGITDGLPYLRPSLEAGWIAAVNGVPTFSGGDVSSVQLLSSACYEAARWCLIADGAWQIPDISLQLPGSFTLVTGSSFAAPQISGALALLQDAFGDLSPHDLRVRLLASADDGFFTPDDTVELATGFNKGYSFTYGLGFLDIEAALKPIGGTAMTLASGAVISTNTVVLQTGTAFGDAVEQSLAGTDVLVKDALSAGFVMPAGALTAASRPGSRAAALLSRSLTGNLAQDRTADIAALSDPF